MARRYQEIIVLAEGHVITVKCHNVVVEDDKPWLVRLVPYSISSSREGELSERLKEIIGQPYHNSAAVRVAVKRALHSAECDEKIGGTDPE